MPIDKTLIIKHVEQQTSVLSQSKNAFNFLYLNITFSFHATTTAYCSRTAVQNFNFPNLSFPRLSHDHLKCILISSVLRFVYYTIDMACSSLTLSLFLASLVYVSVEGSELNKLINLSQWVYDGIDKVTHEFQLRSRDHSRYDFSYAFELASRQYTGNPCDSDSDCVPPRSCYHFVDANAELFGRKSVCICPSLTDVPCHTFIDCLEMDRCITQRFGISNHY